VSVGILIVDDHAGFRAVARSILEADGLTVVGEAATARAAVDCARTLAPALVLLDVHLPDGDGFSVSRQLATLAPPPVVVLTSSREIRDLARRVAQSAAAGFVPKDSLSGDALRSLAG
jgi:DNA-binding NarL/FixJ family response regulator